MVPTRVGVNRVTKTGKELLKCGPHACGGEPDGAGAYYESGYVVPTRVGVNLPRIPPKNLRSSGPHACGGEPVRV